MSFSRVYFFPGQGSQYAGMAKDWFDNFKAAKLAFEEGSEGSGLDLKKLCFDGTDADLKATEITQPAILTATLAIFRALESEGQIDSGGALYMGHSLGEYSALVAAKFFSLHDGTRLVRKRGMLMQKAVAPGVGGMAALIFKPGSDAVALTEDICLKARAQSGKSLSPANFNSPEQIVVAGHTEAVTAACELAPTLGARKAVALPVSAPFHCELMAPASQGLRPDLEAASVQTSALSYIANVDAREHDLKDAAAIKQRLLDQITAPVRWTQSVQRVLELGATQATEIGPGAVLSGLAKRIKFNEQSLVTANIDRWETYKNGLST